MQASSEAVSSCSHEVLTMMADRLRWGAVGARALACASHAMYAAVHCCDRRPGAPMVSFTDDQHVEWLYGLVPCGGGDDADFRCVDGVCRHALCGFGADAWLAALRAVHLGMRAAPSRGVLDTTDITLKVDLEIVHRIVRRIDGLVGLRLGRGRRTERRDYEGPTARAARVAALERHLELAYALPELQELDVSHTPMTESYSGPLWGVAPTAVRPHPLTLIRVLGALNELRVLRMRACDARLSKELFDSIVALPHLRTLHVGGNLPMAAGSSRMPFRDDPTVAQLLEALPQLTDLDVSDLFAHLTQPVVDAIARMTRLERLDLSVSSRGIAGFGDVGGEQSAGALVRTLHGLRHLRRVRMEGRTGLLPLLVRRALARDIQVASGAGTELWPAEADGGCAYDFWSDLPEHPDAPVGLLGGVAGPDDWDAGAWPSR